MNDGFLRVMAITPDVKTGDVKYNLEAVRKAAEEAAEAGASLLVLPELCLTSAGCQDLLLQKTLLDQAEKAAAEAASFTAERDLVLVYSFPLRKDGALFEVAAVAAGGDILGLVPKTCIPDHSGASGSRYFLPAPEENGTASVCGREVPFGGRLLFRCQEQPFFTLGVEMGEDLESACPPSTLHALAGATVIACPAASQEVIGRAAKRRAWILNQAGKGNCAYVYCSAGEGESTGDGVCSAHSLIAEGGYILAEAEPFGKGRCAADTDLEALDHARRKTAGVRDAAEGYDVVSFSLNLPEGGELLRSISKTPFVNEDENKAREAARLSLEIQARGLAGRLDRCGAKKVMLGVSGGLDSTTALLAAVKCFDMTGRDRKDIVAVTMPCFGTSRRTRSNAEKMSRLLKVDFRTVDISRSVSRHLSDIGHDGKTPDVTFENAQARERTQVLMDLANLENGLVLGTGDLSESALGWCTFNGDHISMYNVDCDLPKTFMRSLVYYYADECGSAALKKVLRDVVDTPVSPELKPAVNGEIAQKTEDILGPYEAHDFFLYHMVRNGSGPKKIMRLAKQAFRGIYAEEDLEAWLRKFLWKFFSSQFKRNCTPDGPKVGTVDLSPKGGWRMAGDVSAASFVAELDR